MSEEEIIEENIKRYIKEHSKTIKAYTQEYVDKLQNQLQQKENIIKEVREYMNKHEIEVVYLDCKLYETKVYKDILEILDKGE